MNGRAKLVSAGLGTAALAVAGAWSAEVLRQRPPGYEIRPTPIGSVVLHTGDHLGLPVGIESVGDHLVVIDRAGEKNVHVVDSETGELVASVGRPGDGPAEFRGPNAITRDPAGRVWVFDAQVQRMTRLDLGRLSDGDAWADGSFRLASNSRVIDLTWTADADMLAWGQFLNGRYGRLSDTGELKYETGSFPEEAAGEPAFLNQQVYRVRLGARPDGRLFAAAAHHAGRIDILDAAGERVAGAAVPLPFAPVYEVRTGGAWPVAVFTEDSPLGYIDVATTDRFVFGLFSGRTEADFPGRFGYASDVHVFDWAGNLVDILRLDRDVSAIEVDTSRDRLFAIQHDPMPAILEFDLPENMRERTQRTEVALAPGVGGLR